MEQPARGANPLRADVEASGGLYHSFRLPEGRILRGGNKLEVMEQRLAAFGLPERLDGKKVLDIGPWDGFFTFEMERRGADVTAIDYVDLDTFRALQKTFLSSARYLRMDVNELSAARMGTFDIVLCLGVLYHLRYPIEGLEKICAVTSDVCIVDTFVADGDKWLAGDRLLPYAEFYEHAELAGQVDNWWGPSVSAAAAWTRSAGFARAELLRVTASSATFAAHRRWDRLPEPGAPALALTGLNNHANRGRTFQSSKEEYVLLWADWEGSAPELSEVYPEVDGFAAPPLYVSGENGKLQIAIRVPPGLSPGRHEARLRIGPAGWSEALAFYLDLPAFDGEIELLAVQDGVSWDLGVIDWSTGGWITMWLRGLSDEADAGNVTIFVDGIPHSPEDVHVASGQVNSKLRPLFDAGKHELHAEHRGVRSNALEVEVMGSAPTVAALRGLADERG